jgi:hypothetical protein
VAQLRKGVAEWFLSRYVYLVSLCAFAELVIIVSRLLWCIDWRSWYQIGDRP